MVNQDERSRSLCRSPLPATFFELDVLLWYIGPHQDIETFVVDDVAANDSIGSIKQTVANRIGLPASHLKAFTDTNRNIEDAATLAECGIGQGGELNIDPRILLKVTSVSGQSFGFKLPAWHTVAELENLLREKLLWTTDSLQMVGPAGELLQRRDTLLQVGLEEGDVVQFVRGPAAAVV